MTNEAFSQKDIAARAYSLWEQQGCPEGRDLENWIEAERLLREERGSSSSDSVAPFSPDASRPATVPHLNVVLPAEEDLIDTPSGQATTVPAVPRVRAAARGAGAGSTRRRSGGN